MSINFDRAADYYDATRGYDGEVASAIGRSLAAAVDANPNTRFLEIGIGTGRIALPLAELGYDVTGVDISREMLARLHEKVTALARAGRSIRIRAEEADIHDMPFHDAEFDAVIAVQVFHLVADPVRAAQEAFRVLRPGGTLLICGDMVDGAATPSVTEKWSEIVNRRGFAVPNSSQAVARLIDGLQSTMPNLSVQELRPVSWQSTVSLAEELDSIRRRLWSQTWRLPDDVFDACLRELIAWYDTLFAGREVERLDRTKEFVIRKVTPATMAG